METKRNVSISLIAVYIILVGIRLYWQDIAKASSLELTEEGILGSLKIWGVNSKLNIPLDNISSLYVKESIWDKMRSGKTLGIASSSGSVKFRCVQNADELKKFKELLDAGAISQEEYDSKKKQLLGL
ncbi:MAG: SHOCT domain-containing protein [Oscillospiraceae bacterium]|nr:SHOCT domain-containing protein [Oscillospiraceae bacterium]